MKPYTYELNYSQNWNNKLRLPIHTTLRLASQMGHIKEKDKLWVKLNGHYLYEAVVLSKQEMLFHQVPRPTLWIDTGYSYRGALAIFQRFYKGFRETDRVVLMAIARISQPANGQVWCDLMAAEYNKDFDPEHLTKRVNSLAL